MVIFIKKYLKSMPTEVVDIIADYHDYEKYCKPKHKLLLKNILDNIKDIREIMPSTIRPNIIWHCWGPGAKHLVDSYENENMVGLYDDDYEADMAHFDYEGGGWNDDEENNFGLDYDNTFYYSS